MLAAFKELNENYEPNLAIVIVDKHVSQKFSEYDEKNIKNIRNPPPGTIIDKTIVSKFYDFFLIA